MVPGVCLSYRIVEAGGHKTQLADKTEKLAPKMSGDVMKLGRFWQQISTASHAGNRF
jgi:hypothetical protein